jgi:NAD(P)-dependent dehydrogenase (short-subunit alcohol dehydrogenase family)
VNTNAFAGKVALVTGGTAGIGKATAQLFAQAGANVVIAGRRHDKGKETEQELQGAGGTVLYVQTDVSQPEQVSSCIRKTVERFGRLDYAFNNAADLSKLGRTGDFTEEDFDLEVTLNLKTSGYV